ncbi:SDR family oxidoreductase [Rhodococcus sp. BP-252]|uniref:SDR family oxidoreductase n=1 Tax=unclassified Rhodococcus (in: high G+C Gram-positive bacteria) TaxID=192944 RepID=UPI001431AE2F|nr:MULTISPECIES: SDR family oxidoreductase [unclassified Rhodococcus (in: high G+C Gram-positive bacteria)]MBY6413998.1 SDR family oxidoreductase [Rhodococcus sp. BP-320]MBY6418769.1 SDR family oxidoreductase [Rhodococcus sp. BP-321]MBY6423350.1 SDR family oxidoreductase [Rhodococcus sp. BP-324]MBY6428804.1 SDR family oxidoreductase [Rhodococcus sp. BP-323]MBY6433810.1 SDR family oxidoreductase [Rhodococcus sp. BP-322]
MTGLLDGSVVVVSGIGPSLGRSIALRCAAEGADLVLAARTASYLDDVAKEVAGLGRQAVAVPTDITDEASATRLVVKAVDAFGHVDALINNAFAIPSMKDLAHTEPASIRAGLELSLFGTLRLSQLFTSALTKSRGSIVMINSAVIRHSQPKYGGYKIAKASLLAMSQTLASELGPQGIRVNTVAPGYIWGSTLKSYFEHLAQKYSTTSEQIYRQTASTMDLRRLPEPDEIADAVVFLSSSRARAITGQCLDVNCGEYHH